MDDSGKKHSSPFDKNGEAVRIIEHGKTGSRSALLYKLLALVFIGCFVAYVVTMVIRAPSDSRNPTSDQAEAKVSVPGEDDMGSLESDSRRDRTLTAKSTKASYDPNDLANYVAPGQAPRMEEVIERLHDAGIHTGLGAFNPPGTSPPMIGLAVPDDYVLPEGYVRHFQATDDGQRIEPILMYSPDFEFFDGSGQRIVIPENRVVPDNRAPPGLVIRPIKIPAPLEPGGP